MAQAVLEASLPPSCVCSAPPTPAQSPEKQPLEQQLLLLLPFMFP